MTAQTQSMREGSTFESAPRPRSNEIVVHRPRRDTDALLEEIDYVLSISAKGES